MKTLAHTFTLALIVALLACPSSADEATPEKSARQPVKLPGLVIDFEKRCVDLEGTICLDQGFLELVACTKGSKQHESIVAIVSRPMHLHTALLLLGATNGNPAMRKAVNKEKTRWVHLPPRGDPIGVYLVVNSADGKMIERPIGDYISRSNQRTETFDANENNAPAADAKFPHTFLFAGSHLIDNDKGPRKYVADSTGNVISIVTFGDELLCLPGIQSHENGALEWQVNSTHLPKVGTKVTLRLRPEKPKPSKAKSAPTKDK